MWFAALLAAALLAAPAEGAMGMGGMANFNALGMGNAATMMIHRDNDGNVIDAGFAPLSKTPSVSAKRMGLHTMGAAWWTCVTDIAGEGESDVLADQLIDKLLGMVDAYKYVTGAKRAYGEMRRGEITDATVTVLSRVPLIGSFIGVPRDIREFVHKSMRANPIACAVCSNAIVVGKTEYEDEPDDEDEEDLRKAMFTTISSGAVGGPRAAKRNVCVLSAGAEDAADATSLAKLSVAVNSETLNSITEKDPNKWADDMTALSTAAYNKYFADRKTNYNDDDIDCSGSDEEVGWFGAFFGMCGGRRHEEELSLEDSVAQLEADLDKVI